MYILAIETTGPVGSVAIAEALKETLSDPSLSVIVEHRDLERDPADDRIKG